MSILYGNRVRHGSEQPYHRLPMLRGLTGFENADGSSPEYHVHPLDNMLTTKI